MDENSARITGILEALKDGIYIINADYQVEYMNRALRDSFGDGTGRRCWEVVAGMFEKCPWCRADDVFKKKQINRYHHHDEASGKHFDVTDLPLDNEDGSVSKLTIFRDVTALVEQKEKLRITEQDYKRLFEAVDRGVYISSKEGKFLDVNPALVRMLGYDDKEEVLALDIAHDLYARPEDRVRFQELIEHKGQVVDYEVEFKRKDGQNISVLITGSVRYDSLGRVLGYEGIIVDQTRRILMEKRLREANDFFNKIIASSPNAIMASDMKGNILIWNRAAEIILGYSAEDVIGKMNIVKVYPEGMAKHVMQLMRSDEHGGKGVLRSYPLTALKKNGELLEANLSAAIIYDEKGKEQASVGIMVDLKERLEMERTLSQTQEQLLQSEKLAAMGRLTSQIAHELNNPLYGIMNTLELLKTEIPPQNRRRKILEMALSETVRLTDMLKKMLIFSKPDQEIRQVAELNSIVDEIMLLSSKQLWEYSIKVKIELAENLPEIYASKNQLRQVVLNMVSNARDAMPEGGMLTISTGVEGGFVWVRFEDTGVGIKEENLDKIFEAFFTTKDSIKGVGLGLSVCYGFIRDHGGDIRVSSKVGKGTVFTVLLPAHKGEVQ